MRVRTSTVRWERALGGMRAAAVRRIQRRFAPRTRMPWMRVVPLMVAAARGARCLRAEARGRAGGAFADRFGRVGRSVLEGNLDPLLARGGGPECDVDPPVRSAAGEKR